MKDTNKEKVEIPELPKESGIDKIILADLENRIRAQNDSFKEGVLTGINYIISFHPDLYDEYGDEVTWKDLEDWGAANIFNEACENAKKEEVEFHKKALEKLSKKVVQN